MQAKTFVGIDISQDALDVALWPSQEVWSVSRDEEGERTLVRRLREAKPALIVLEATGGMEIPVAVLLAQAQLPVAIVNPRQVREFARATGKLAKTDRLDALVLAHFAYAIRPEPRPLPDEDLQALRALVARRQQLVQMRVAEQNRLRTAPKSMHPSLRAHIKWLDEEIQRLDQEIHDHIQNSPLWRVQEKLFRSVPGVGPTVTYTLFAFLPELGTLSHKKLAALVGVAPLNNDSGRRRGKRSIWGGRAHVRRALYMATLAAIRHNPVIRRFYEHLLARGKAKKVAIVACMHKLLTILNAIAKNGSYWKPTTCHST